MLKVKYGENLFDIVGTLSITTASNEVSFDDISIDFTGHTINELPIKYQEIKVVETQTNENIYYGYLDSYSINERKNENEDAILDLSLLTPMKMATVRYVSIYGTYSLNNLVQEVLKPLLEDGFVLEYIDIPEMDYKVKWTVKSVEECMNIICSSYNLWWYIDEKKKVYIRNVTDLLNSSPKTIISKNNYPEGLFSVRPELATQRYANQITIKNARVVRKGEGCGTGMHGYPQIFFDRLKKLYYNEEYEFDNPIVFYNPNDYSEDQVLFRIYLQNVAIFVTGMLSDGTIRGYYYVDPVYTGYDPLNPHEVEISDYSKKVVNKGMAVQADGMNEDEEDKYIILFKRDNFFKNLITGFKFKKADETIVYPSESPYSDTCLVYETYTVKNEGEIGIKKGVISESGIVEEIIDANEKWFKDYELYSYATNQFESLIGSGTKVILSVDKEPNIKIGDLVQFDWDEFFVKDKCVCYKIDKTINHSNYIEDTEWQLEFVNAELNSTFIDLFRPKETEESDDRIIYQVYGVFDTEHVNENIIIKKDEVV